ncbi:hypothetical protein ACWEWX_54875, partial [Streptomyces asiaticus]
MRTAQQPATRHWRHTVAPGGLPLAGHALLMARKPLQFLASLPAHGDLVTGLDAGADDYLVKPFELDEL